MKLLIAFLLTLLVGAASATTTNKNVDIIVTHTAASGFVTSYTSINNGPSPLTPGQVITGGQCFRRGDLPPGNSPQLRDGADHTKLVWQMDEIDTRHENGDDGSLRCISWSIQLPATSSQYVGGVVPVGGKYKVEFLSVTGAYAATGKQTLAGLCAAHDLKVRFEDVRNQDDSARGSGAMTFDTCANVSNIGRDAPRHLWAGPVLDLWEVRGVPVYDASGQKDPLIYVVCDLYLTTSAANQTSLGPVRHVCEIYNSWMNVAANSSGNAGNPGPLGFANDPQAISYRPSMLDGNTTILDWNGLDATVTSASNPVQGPVCGSDYQGTIPACLNVPSSTGANAWYFGQATRVTSTGTPVGGLKNGGLYFVYNAGSSNFNGANTNLVSLKIAPELTLGAPNVEALALSQGSGSTTFAYRVWHATKLMWMTLDPSGDDNWTNGTSRVTHQVLPAFTTAEQTYWEETGTVIPMNLTQNPSFGVQWSQGNDLNYHPLGKLNVIGGTAPGPRPDIGIINEYAATAFVAETPGAWTKARQFTLGTTHYAYGAMLNEATGRIPPVNNGPPTGSDGNGVGLPYSELGAPYPLVGVPAGHIAQPLNNVPINGLSYTGGMWSSAPASTYISHEPSFTGVSYHVFGARHYLDLIWALGNRAAYFVGVGPGDGYRDNSLDGYHFWGLSTNCCQSRGSAWALREKVNAAALGGDSNQERQYFEDMLTENGNYYPHWMAYKNGTSQNYETSLSSPNQGTFSSQDPFNVDYMFATTYLGWQMLHQPMFGSWIPGFQRFYEGVLGEKLQGHLSAYYAIDYSYSPATHDGDQPLNLGNMGPAMNGTDASDFGAFSVFSTVGLPGGQIKQASPVYTLTAGDKVKNVNNAFSSSTGYAIDQLPGNQWFEIIGPIDNTVGTYYVKCPIGHAVDATCPTPGAAFTGFSRNGVPIVNETGDSIIYRPQYAPATGFSDGNYMPYVGQILAGLQILGQDVNAARAIFTTRGGDTSYNPQAPSQWWNPNAVVP
jgi:hypothetical protein